MKQGDGVTPFPGAEAVIDLLLPRTSIVFGRDATPRAHRLYFTTAPLTTEQHRGLEDAMLIELRGLSKRGPPQQTIIPPGVHETGELIRFAEFGPPLAAVDRARSAAQHAARL